MPVVATIDATLDLNTGNFTGGISIAGAALRQFDTNINRANGHVKSFGNSLMGTVVVLGQLRAAMHTVWALTGQWGYAIIEANAKLERLQVLMRGLSKSTTAVGQLTDSLRDMNYVLEKAKSAPFSIDEIGNAFVKLKAAGIDPTKGALDSLMNAVANFGGDDQTFHRATVAIQQMAGKGVISMEELRQQLGEAVPNAMQLLARATNMTMAQLVKTISTGRLAAKPALDKLFREMQFAFDGSGERMMDTWVGLMSRLKTEWLIFAKDIGDQGLFDAAKKAVTDLMTLMASPEGKRFAYEMGQGLKTALEMAIRLINYLVSHRETIVSWGKILATIFAAKMLANFTTALVKVVGSVATATARLQVMGTTTAVTATAFGRLATGISAIAGPIGIAIGLVGALTMQIANQINTINNARDAFISYLEATNKGELVSPAQHAEQVENLKMMSEVAKKALELRKMYDPSGDPKALKIGTNIAGPIAHFKANRLLNQLRDANMLPDEATRTDFWDAMMQGPQNTGNFTEKMAVIEKAMKQFNMRRSLVIRQGVEQAANADSLTIDGYVSKVTKQMAKSTGGINTKLEDIDKRLTDHVITGPQAMAERIKVMEEHYDVQIKGFEAAGARLKTSLEKAKGNERETALVTGLIEKNNEKLQALRAERKGASDTDNPLMPKMGGADEAKSAEKKQNALLDFYESIKAKVAGLQGQIDQGMPSFERFQSIYDGGRKYSKDPAVFAAIKAEFEKEKALKADLKEMQGRDRAMQTLDEMKAASAADVMTNTLRIQADELGLSTSGLITFNRQVEVMRLSMGGASASEMEEFNQKAKDIAATLAKIDLQNFAYQTKQGEWDLSLDKLPKMARAQEEYNRKLNEYGAMRAALLRADPGNVAGVDSEMERRKALDLARFNYDNRSSLRQWLDTWGDTTDEMDALWGNSMDTIADSLTEMVTTGKASFRELASTILKEITRVLMSKAIAKLAEVVMSFIPGFGPSSTAGASSGGGAYWHAKGGVMSSTGPMPLKMYSKGGVANSPQMSIFGEGRLPEAYVPLPDGRNIPVKMEGGGGGGANVPVGVNVTIMSDGSGRSDSNSDREDGRALGKQLEGMIKDGMAREARPGGTLWKILNGR